MLSNVDTITNSNGNKSTLKYDMIGGKLIRIEKDKSQISHSKQSATEKSLKGLMVRDCGLNSSQQKRDR